jgi:glycosyltransferase involved in cell wall biosynthesis
VRLSVVIPVYNEADQVVETIQSATAAVREEPAFADSEIVVSDDGSTADVASPALAAADGVPVRIERLSTNSGRFEARRAGLHAAEGEIVLFIDAGVTLVPGSLAFVAPRVDQGRDVWNAHTEIETEGSLFALFWKVVTSLAFGDYVDHPRETSFGVDEFDRFPKGTTCFLAPRSLLVEAFDAFRSRYADTRNANDDGPIIRWVAARSRVNIAPSFACVYTPRRTLRSFVKHALHRGVVFVDGHGRPESRFFPLVVAFFPVSAALAVATVKRPLVAPLAALGVAGAAAVAASRRRRSTEETLAFAALAPVYAVAHGVGMWRGAALALAGRLRQRT